MELQDYWVALRRYWTTWLGVALAGLLAALGVVLVTPPTYQTTAEVFVASIDGSTDGSQFVRQRVTSYPQVVDSQTVLAPVIDQLGLTQSFSALRAQVSATNPVDTSQIEIAVTDGDAKRSAQIANAVAARFGTAVEELEKPAEGASPVSLTVTNPATVPTSPISPVPSLLLPLGLIVGLALGAAAAVLRSRLDNRLHSADDVRAAWGLDPLVVHTALPGRRRRARRVHRPTTLLARQLEPMAEREPVRVLVLSPSADQAPAEALVEQVAAELTAWEMPVEVLSAAEPSGGVAVTSPGVQLRLTSPLTSLQEWRRSGRVHAGVVLVVQPGRVDRADLVEMRSVLDAAGVRVLAVVLPLAERRRSARRLRSSGTTAPAGSLADRLAPPAPAPARKAVLARSGAPRG
jgi:capsular polysaccharide biosynthesis protein